MGSHASPKSANHDVISGQTPFLWVCPRLCTRVLMVAAWLKAAGYCARMSVAHVRGGRHGYHRLSALKPKSSPPTEVRIVSPLAAIIAALSVHKAGEGNMVRMP